jgi:hypothetical protein
MVEGDVDYPFFPRCSLCGTMFEIDIDSFEEKPWRLPKIDITDLFNFSLDEDRWKE